MSEQLKGLLLWAVLQNYGWTTPAARAGWRTTKCYDHPDSHASCRINYDLGQVICQACGFHGDGYSIIMDKEGIGFVEAVKFSEESLGVRLPTVQRKHSGRSNSSGVSHRQRDQLGSHQRSSSRRRA